MREANRAGRRRFRVGRDGAVEVGARRRWRGVGWFAFVPGRRRILRLLIIVRMTWSRRGWRRGRCDGDDFVCAKGFRRDGNICDRRGRSVSVLQPNPNSHQLSWSFLPVPTERSGAEARIEFWARPSTEAGAQVATIAAARTLYDSEELKFSLRRPALSGRRVFQVNGESVAMNFSDAPDGLSFGMSEAKYSRSDAADADDVCAAVGSSWRLPNVAEAAGLGSVAPQRLVGAGGPPGWADGVAVPSTTLERSAFRWPGLRSGRRTVGSGLKMIRAQCGRCRRRRRPR